MADLVQEYPMWVKVKGDGDPLQPGYELANSPDEEAALAKAKPADPEITDQVAVAIVNLGFGKFQQVNAAGERFGDKLKKADAEATGLPIAKPDAE